jgi:hypothetical protein
MTSAIVTLPGDLSIAVRQMTEADRPYILSSWSKHLAHWLEHQQRCVDVNFGAINRRCQKLLARHGALVATNPDNDRQMLGWACINKGEGVVHFVFTLAPFRNNGVAKALCASLKPPFVASHWSLDAETWLQHKFDLRYSPSQAR